MTWTHGLFPQKDIGKDRNTDVEADAHEGVYVVTPQTRGLSTLSGILSCSAHSHNSFVR